MRTSESVAKIAPALVSAQAAIRAVVKDKVGRIPGKDGKQGYEYRYSDLGSVIDHVRGPLNTAGIAFLQAAARDQGGIIVTTRLLHTSGEWIEDDTPIPCPVSTAQAYGSAITYGKRYGLQSIIGLPSEDDDGKRATDDAEQANRDVTEQEISDALMLLAEEATEGMAAVQQAMEGLRPKLQAHLRKAKKAELASIKIAATKNEAPEPA